MCAYTDPDEAYRCGKIDGRTGVEPSRYFPKLHPSVAQSYREGYASGAGEEIGITSEQALLMMAFLKGEPAAVIND